MMSRLPAIQHAAASVMVTEVERVISSGVLSFDAETRLRTRTNAFCRECDIAPVWQNDNVSAAEYDKQLEAIQAVLTVPV